MLLFERPPPLDQCSFFAALCLLCTLGLSQLFTRVLFIHFAVCLRIKLVGVHVLFVVVLLARWLALFTFRSVFCLSNLLINSFSC